MPVGAGSPDQPQLDVGRAPGEPRDSPTDCGVGQKLMDPTILSAKVLGMSACSAIIPLPFYLGIYTVPG